MFTLRRHRPTCAGRTRLTQFACVWIVTAVALGACSRQSSSISDDWTLDTGDVVRADTSAGGVEASYAAYFEDGRLQRIGEKRTSADGSVDATYEFKGARLVKYQGASLSGRQRLSLEFDMQGALTTQGTATDEEIAAVVNRASLLRSLALARRATQSHGG